MKIYPFRRVLRKLETPVTQPCKREEEEKKHVHVLSQDLCSSHGLYEQCWLFTGQGAIGGDVSL